MCRRFTESDNGISTLLLGNPIPFHFTLFISYTKGAKDSLGKKWTGTVMERLSFREFFFALLNLIAFQAFSDENFKGKSTSAEKDVPNSERTGQF
ncbi:hypothetical protein LguiB_026247 [Lonicera macranthoides]